MVFRLPLDPTFPRRRDRYVVAAQINFSCNAIISVDAEEERLGAMAEMRGCLLIRRPAQILRIIGRMFLLRRRLPKDSLPQSHLGTDLV
jgi:hypothetical protein